MSTHNRDITEPLISIIIRCFNEEKHIGSLLEAIQRQNLRDLEIILVDSGSTDQTLDIAKAYSPAVVHIKPVDFTFGFSLNQGCRAAKGKFLVIVSAHVIPEKSTWLDELIRPFADPNVALVYGRQIGNSITRFSEHEVFAQQFPNKSNFKQLTPFCNNANAAIRREIWERRSYDETLTGLEDLDMGVWVLSQGMYLAYNSDAAIFHIHDEIPSKIFNRYKREAIAMKRILPDSHLTLWEFIFFWLSTIVLDILRAIKVGVIFKSFFEIIMFRTMQYWGTYSGLHDRTPLTHEMIMRFYYPRKPQRFMRK